MPCSFSGAQLNASDTHFLTNCSESLILGMVLLNAVFLAESIPGFLNASCLQPSYTALFLVSKSHFCFKRTISFQDPYLVCWKLCVMC